MNGSLARGSILLACWVGAGCAVPRPAARVASPPEPLPELIVAQPAPQPLGTVPTARPDPLASVPSGGSVTLSARNVDVAVLLASLAEQAGISLVIDPSISARTTVNFSNLPVVDALRVVLAAANLGIAAGPPTPPSGATVFYTLPVNIDEASAELIQARFRVSPELARWIVRSRVP